MFQIKFLCIYFWLHWVSLAVCEFSVIVASGGYSLVLALGLLITGAPLASLAWAPEHRLSSCGAQA